MATFVDIATEEAQLSELAVHLNKLQVSKDGGENESNAQSLKDLSELAKNSKVKEVLTNVIDRLDLVLADANEKDVEGTLNVIFSLLRKLDAASVDDLAKKLVGKITSDPNDKSLLRIKILNNLYNTFDTDSITRYEVYVSIVQYALDSKNSDVIVPTFKKIDEWLKIWGANLEQTRKLYQLMLKTLEAPGTLKFADDSREVQAYGVLIKYLQTFDASNQDALATAKPDAIKAAVQAIKTPEIHQCDDLLDIPAVKQLENEPTHSKLFELLKLFAIDKLDSFTAFHEKNPEYLQSLGISHDDCVRKIRLLSLASLAVEQSEIPYSLIAQTLKINEDDVETWVILSIRTGLIEAKLDQLRSVVIINRATQRVFTIDQWKHLSSKLGAWKENVKSILSVIKTTQVNARGSLESVGGNASGDHRRRRH